MAHIGFLCPPIPGHLNPIATLGRAMAKRGHKATVFQVPAARSKIEAQQLEFKPLGDGSRDGREITDAVEKLGALSGLNAIRFSIQCGTLLAKTICEYGPNAIRSAGVELLVVDQNEPAGGVLRSTSNYHS